MLFAHGFRPFFLFVGAFAALFVPIWVAVLAGALPAPAGVLPTAWHAHEMVFGFALGAAAGFLTTAVPVWSGTELLQGGRLAALVGIWLAGRVAMALAGLLPAAAAAAVDLLFLPALIAALAPALLRPEQRRNAGFLLVLAALFAANACYHAHALGLLAAWGSAGLRLAVDLVAVLVVVIGGRIVPAFTRNALLRDGIPTRVVSRPLVERTVVPAVLVFALCDLLAPYTAARGVAALAAAALLAVRLGGWSSLRTWRDPLVWSLHLGYAWLPAGFALIAASDLGAPVPATAGLHAITAGAFGTMILAVMTRVSLGHTGRPLVAPPPIAAAYLLVTAGALLRVAAPASLLLLVVSGLIWASAFAIFTAVYEPILTSPRVDGQPG